MNKRNAMTPRPTSGMRKALKIGAVSSTGNLCLLNTNSKPADSGGFENIREYTYVTSHSELFENISHERHEQGLKDWNCFKDRKPLSSANSN